MRPQPFLSQLPADARAIIRSAPETEFATLSSAGAPIGNPVFYYPGMDGTSIDVATGLAYPGKANRARRNRKVGLLFAPGIAAHDPVVRNALSGQAGRVDARPVTAADPPVALVSALATVRDADIQGNTDRYVRDYVGEHPLNTSWEEEQRRVWYYARIYIECRPVKVQWWPSGLTGGSAPLTWEAQDPTAPDSDPVPAGAGTRPAEWPAPDWRQTAERVLGEIPAPTLTLVDPEGFPLPFPTLAARLADDGFDLTLPGVVPWVVDGPACLTFAVSATFLGRITVTDAAVRFRVERLVGNLPLSGNEQMARDSAEARERLMLRLHAELERRGQPLPQVRMTG